MNIKFYILIILLFAASCSSVKTETETAQKPEVMIEDGYKTSENGELLIEDKDIKPVQEPVVTTKANSQQNNIVASDGSKISVMLDGYGNKSETRYFDNHPRLQMVLLRTAANGDKQIFVYGQNGEVKDLPPNMANSVMTSPADDLAKASGITEGRKQQTISQTFSGVNTQSTTASLQALPNNQLPTESRTVNNAKPQNEAREETLARQTESIDKNDSSEETKTPAKLSENLQNYLPKKRKDVITDN